MDEGAVFNMYREVPSVAKKQRGLLAILIFCLIVRLQQELPKRTNSYCVI